MKKICIASLVTFFLLLPTLASAHSVVSPPQTTTSKYENFSLSVPVEKDIPTVGVRLTIPQGVDRVTPVVKPGWQIKTTKDAAGKVTEISWTGGTIPAGQKDFFQFSARTSASSTILIWKAYQTYRDGSVVAWDRDPAKPNDSADNVENPYSTTEVLETASAKEDRSSSFPMSLSLLSLVLSVVALVTALKNRHHEH